MHGDLKACWLVKTASCCNQLLSLGISSQCVRMRLSLGGGILCKRYIVFCVLGSTVEKLLVSCCLTFKETLEESFIPKGCFRLITNWRSLFEIIYGTCSHPQTPTLTLCAYRCTWLIFETARWYGISDTICSWCVIASACLFQFLFTATFILESVHTGFRKQNLSPLFSRVHEIVNLAQWLPTHSWLALVQLIGKRKEWKKMIKVHTSSFFKICKHVSLVLHKFPCNCRFCYTCVWKWLTLNVKKKRKRYRGEDLAW